VADSLEDAVKKEEAIKKLSVVATNEGVDSIARFVTADQTEQLKLVKQIKQSVSGFSFHDPDIRPVNIPELSRTLYSLYGYLGLALDEVQKDDPELAKRFVSLRQAIDNFRKEMLKGDQTRREENAEKLGEFQQALFNDVREMFHSLQSQDDSAPLQIADLPQALRDRFVGVTGKILLQVYPKKDVWVRENQK